MKRTNPLLHTIALGWVLSSPLLALGPEPAQDEDHVIALEIGPALERDIKSKVTASGASIGVEVTAIENWLELEVSSTFMEGAGQRQGEGEVLFKMPFRLSSTSEFMIGVGPQFGWKVPRDGQGTSVGIAYGLDFMFWPTRRLGWYFAPEYAVGTGRSAGEKSLGLSAGILIGW